MSSDRKSLITKIDNLIILIDKINLPKNEHSKYLLNHLRIFLEKIKTGNCTDLINAAERFGMYCTEHMDWDTEEYKTYIELAKIGRKIGKKES